jgi:hypothetical protein
MPKRKVEAVHHSIKTRLGYPKDTSDEEFWKDWNGRTKKVCKPCWELKYCPYGKMVDLSPLLPISREEASDDRQRILELLKAGVLGRDEILSDEEKNELEIGINEIERDPIEYALEFQNQIRVEQMIQEEIEAGETDPIGALMGLNPAMQHYRTAFPIESESERRQRQIDAFTPEVKTAIKKRLKQLKGWLKSGIRNDSKPLEGWRKSMFERRVKSYSPEDFPEKQPQRIYECACNVFGHVCPVFFTANSMTETSNERRRGRYISFETKMRVVRRDNYTCQHCGTHLLDTEVEFDHVIPLSKGGSSEEANIRLTCFDCNRSKSNNVDI